MDTELWYAKSNHIPVLGHRGICSKFPENTLVSFEAAINLGVDLIEFDVNITKDGIPVVIHDNGCDNITGNNPEIALNTLRKIGLHK